MADFQPSGIFRIGQVPFDDSYKHTRWFESKSAQNNYFSSCMLSQYTESDYTYIRHNNSVKVQVNREKVCNVNYCMFQNRNYGSKWFYAFVVGINYINENVTEIVMELDVMQTWLFDWTRTECFVEREHVSNDSLFAHTNPEPEIPLRYRMRNRVSEGLDNNMKIVVCTAANPKYDGTTQPVGSIGVGSGIVDGVFTGCKYRVWDRSEAASEGEYGISNYLASMQTAGAGDAISSIFMISGDFIPSSASGGASIPNTVHNTGTIKTGSLKRPTEFGGYTPKNNKLYCYPYSYAKMRDNRGSSVELMWEMWGSNDTYYYNIVSSIDPQAIACIYPTVYAGTQQNWNQGITTPVTVQCSWPYSNYNNWSAQNSLANDLKFAVNVAGIVFVAAKGAAAAGKVLGATSAAARAGNAAAMTNLAKRETGRAAASAFTHNAIGGIGGMSMIAGGMGLGNQLADISRQSKIPDSTRGGAAGNTTYQCQAMQFHIEAWNLDSEYARIVDDFFSMYGYQVDLVKVPNFHSRSTWNYVKTANACMRGSVPSEDMAAINSILDSGITFWHTSAIGNYSASNGII